MEALIALLLMAFGVKAMSSSGSGSGSSESATTSSDGSYDFDYRFVDGEWRAYIRSQPDYGAREDDLHSTHRHWDSRGHYVCWNEPIESRSDCEAVAKAWAQGTDRYIRTGERF
jgi:hypothetical protein